jgi:hypothetical protein
MKRITISNVVIQFDGDLVTTGTPEEQALKLIDDINSELSNDFPDACPQILSPAPGEYEVKAEDYEDYEDEEDEG